MSEGVDAGRTVRGWTGGQYSLVRAAFGGVAAVRGLVALVGAGSARPLAAGLTALAVAASLALAAGWHRRVAAAAVALLAIGTGALAAPAAGALAGLAVPAVLFAAHELALPVAPYGSVDASGRTDPGGGWRLPRRLRTALAAALTACVLAAVAASTDGLPAWLASPLAGDPSWLLPAVLLADPRWIPPLAAGGRTRAFYDGTCGLCHRTVRLLLAEDPGGEALRFAPLDSEAFRLAVPEEARAGLPDSLVAVTPDGALLTRSSAVAHLLARLGGAWRLAAWVVLAFPRPVRDAAYDGVARVRRRLFAAPDAACPLLPERLRDRFDA